MESDTPQNSPPATHGDRPDGDQPSQQSVSEVPPAAKKKPPIRPVTPRLRIVLYVGLTLFSVLAANGLYLTSITWIQHIRGEIYENHFYQLMFLGHLGLGLLLIGVNVVPNL